MTSAAEYERRIDRKLRKVRKETEKLRRIKNQLKKYIPDLTSSGSESSTSSSADERRSERGRTTNHRNSSAVPAAIAVAHPRRSNAQGEPTRVYM
jgi:glutamate synthase domain-containing protein 1